MLQKIHIFFTKILYYIGNLGYYISNNLGGKLWKITKIIKISSKLGTKNNTEPASTYVAVNSKKEKAKIGFAKGVFLPFLCGALGTSVVIGTCFGVPQIKNQLFGTTNSADTSSIIEKSQENNASLQNTSNTQSNLNTLNNQNNSATGISLSNYSETGVSVANKVLPSIVGIKVEYSVNSIFYRSFGQTSTSKAEAQGSGIIISEDGYILTNNHIVNTSSTSSYYEVGKATKVSVFLYNDETEYEAKIIGTDEQTDLAVIKIEKTGLTAAELGNSDEVQVGEFSMAIGNPLGLQSSVTAGMISAVNRDVKDSDGKTYKLLQTDAAINSGNSGGALVNSKGQVIGVNTLKLSGTGIEGMGFAIPINSTKDIYSQLIQYNKVKRPYIGIRGIDLTEELAKANNLVIGIYVQSVEDFSSAQKADVRNGDVIIEADGQKVTKMDELNELKNKHNIGDEFKLKVNRNGEEKEITLTLGESK